MGRLIENALPERSLTEPGVRVRFLIGTQLQRLAVAFALDAHDRWLAWNGAVLGRSEGAALRARYHRQAGERDKARDHAEHAFSHACAPRQPLALIAAHRLLGELDTEAERYEDATCHLDESLQLVDACEAPYERALTLLAMAELPGAMGVTGAAITLLDEVKAICAPLGAQPALARADVLAARLTSG